MVIPPLTYGRGIWSDEPNLLIPFFERHKLVRSQIPLREGSGELFQLLLSVITPQTSGRGSWRELRAFVDFVSEKWLTKLFFESYLYEGKRYASAMNG